MARVAVGIDLGTTNSLVAVEKKGQIHVVSVDGSSRLLASAIYMGKPRIFGEHALRRELTTPGQVLHSVKRLMGQKYADPTVRQFEKSVGFKVIQHGSEGVAVEVDWPDQQKVFTPEQISAMILAELKKKAEDLLGKSVDDAVITVPAAFNHTQRMATKVAGEIAGFDRIAIISEPTAAALAWADDNRATVFDGERKVILVFDMGGGTTDVSIVSIESNKIEVMQTVGDPYLGGTDVDQVLVNHFVEEIKDRHGTDISTNPRKMASLRKVCRDFKHQLKTAPTVISMEDNLIPEISVELRLTKSRFEHLLQEFKESVSRLIQNATRSMECSGEPVDITSVVLVGGSSKMTWIEGVFKASHSGNMPFLKNVNPDEAVAYGAGLYACKLFGAKDVCPAIEIRDVAPLTYGIDSSGRMSVIIPRNKPLPYTSTKCYKTKCDQQVYAGIRIYEGDSEEICHNRLLSEFLLPLQSAKRGEQIVEVTFTFSEDFMLTVRVKDSCGGGASHEIQLKSKDTQNLTVVEEAQRTEKRLAEADQQQDDE